MINTSSCDPCGRLNSIDHEFNFSSLLQSIGKENFLHNFYEKKHAVFEAAIRPETLNTLFNYELLDRVLTSTRSEFPMVETISEGFTEKPKSVSPADIAQDMAGGKSLRIMNMDRVSPAIASASAVLARELAASVQANLYVTPSNELGFTPHYDDHDVLIIQCCGSKNWRIYECYSNSIELPLQGTGFDKEKHIPGPVLEEFKLQAGDALYIPRGLMHCAEATEEGSSHLTFGVHTIPWVNLLSALISCQTRKDVQWRKQINPSTLLDQNIEKSKRNIHLLIDSLKDDALLIEAIEMLQSHMIDRQYHPMEGLLARELTGESLKPSTKITFRESVFYFERVKESHYEIVTRDRILVVCDREYQLFKFLKQQQSLTFAELEQMTAIEDLGEFVQGLFGAGLLCLQG